jgi:hypothetical protein
MMEEEPSVHESQNHEESIYINKVNEMQIRTSRFDQQQLLRQNPLFFHHLAQPRPNQVPEDYIPSEEPVINVREFRGNNFERSRLEMGRMYQNLPHPRLLSGVSEGLGGREMAPHLGLGIVNNPGRPRNNQGNERVP